MSLKAQGFFPRGNLGRGKVGLLMMSSRLRLGDKMGLDCGSFENQTEDFYSVCDYCRQYCYLPTQQILLTLLFSLLAEQIINNPEEMVEVWQEGERPEIAKKTK